MKYTQTIWVKNEASLVKMLNELWTQWGGEITFAVEQDNNGYTINFETK